MLVYVGTVLSTCCNKCRAEPPIEEYTGVDDFFSPRPRPKKVDPPIAKLVARGLCAFASTPSSSLLGDALGSHKDNDEHGGQSQ